MREEYQRCRVRRTLHLTTPVASVARPTIGHRNAHSNAKSRIRIESISPSTTKNMQTTPIQTRPDTNLLRPTPQHCLCHLAPRPPRQHTSHRLFPEVERLPCPGNLRSNRILRTPYLTVAFVGRKARTSTMGPAVSYATPAVCGSTGRAMALAIKEMSSHSHVPDASET